MRGRRLIFITLPNVFTGMAGGRVWGALFFLFMTFASFTTVVAVFENIIASCHGAVFGIERRRACVLGAAFILLASRAVRAGLQPVERLPAAWARAAPCSTARISLSANLLLPFGTSGVSALLRDEMGLGL